MVITAATLFMLAFGGSTYDIINGTNYVEAVTRVVCHKTGGEWINLHSPQAACISQETHLVVPDAE